MYRKSWFQITALLIAIPVLASAEIPSELTIKDTSGIVRNVTQTEDPMRVEFHVLDASNQPADGAEITLKNEAGGVTLTAVSAAGVVAFESVAPGTWTVASLSPSITFTDIVISAAGTADVTGSGAALGPVLAAGGGIVAAGAGAFAIYDAVQDDEQDMTPHS